MLIGGIGRILEGIVVEMGNFWNAVIDSSVLFGSDAANAPPSDVDKKSSHVFSGVRESKLEISDEMTCNLICVFYEVITPIKSLVVIMSFVTWIPVSPLKKVHNRRSDFSGVWVQCWRRRMDGQTQVGVNLQQEK
jgi:hypothetical protein